VLVVGAAVVAETVAVVETAVGVVVVVAEETAVVGVSRWYFGVRVVVVVIVGIVVQTVVEKNMRWMKNSHPFVVAS
jgi:hypothetical protein